MGKDKEQKLEAPGSAFSRMNYLYQAAHLMTNLSPGSSLSNYYNKTMKEISKKIVEKLHPDLKRTLCSSCNYSLTARSNDINVKVKHHRRRQRRKKLKLKTKEQKWEKSTNDVVKEGINKFYKSRLEARNKKPNKVWWSCSKCNYTKGYVLQPSYKLWIHNIQEDQKT